MSTVHTDACMHAKQILGSQTDTITHTRTHVRVPTCTSRYVTLCTSPVHVLHVRARTHARTRAHTHSHTKTCAFEVTHKEAPCSLQRWREGRQRCVRHLMNEAWSESPGCMHLILLFISLFPPPQLTALALNTPSSSSHPPSHPNRLHNPSAASQTLLAYRIYQIPWIF